MKIINEVNKNLIQALNAGDSAMLKIFYNLTFLYFKNEEIEVTCPDWANKNTFKKYVRAARILSKDFKTMGFIFNESKVTSVHEDIKEYIKNNGLTINKIVGYNPNNGNPNNGNPNNGNPNNGNPNNGNPNNGNPNNGNPNNGNPNNGNPNNNPSNASDVFNEKLFSLIEEYQKSLSKIEIYDIVSNASDILYAKLTKQDKEELKKAS